MFQFTTTNVINSDKDLTTGKSLWTVQEAANGNPASLNIKRVNNFKAPNVSAIYKAVANDPEMAKVTFDLTKVNGQEGQQYRLSLYIGLTEGSSDSRYSNDLYFKGKPFSIDFVWNGGASKVAETLVKNINKYELLVYGDKILDVSYSGTFISIEAKTEYQRFKSIKIEKFNETANHNMGEYTVVRSLDDISKKNTNSEVEAKAEGFFKGKEGFGTYSYLLHNLRLPTSMRTRAFGINQEENPIMGAKYNQYVIHYCVNRGVLGLNAVGDVTRSVTTHVFYVKQELATDFENALSKIGTVITVNGGKTPDPDTVSGDIAALERKVAAIEATLANKQDTLSEGDGISLNNNEVAVKLDGNSLTTSAAGLKVTNS